MTASAFPSLAQSEAATVMRKIGYGQDIRSTGRNCQEHVVHGAGASCSGNPRSQALAIDCVRTLKFVRIGTMGAKKGKTGDEAAPARPGDIPDIAGLLRRLRQQNDMSLKEVGEASGLSPSFLGAVERGDSDIAVQRLARVAAVFGHDVGSLLGYSLRSVAPRIVSAEDRFNIDRGDGVTYEVMRIREIDFELVVATLAPGSAFRETISHAGLDVLMLIEGAVIIEYEGLDFPVKEGQTTVFAGSHPHRVRNDGAHPARFVSMTTARMY